MVGVVNDDGIGIGYVQAVFDQARTEEDVVFAFIEIEHDRFQQAPGHLAVGDADGHIRQEGLEFVFHLFDGRNAVVDEEDLAAPPFFAHNGIADDAGVVFGHIGLDRETVCRRRFDDAHFPQVDQGHVQRPRNRRGAQGQDVDIGCPGLPFFLLGHAEALFFIDDQETQVLELDLLVEQAVGPDEDVDIAGQGPGQDIFLFFIRAEAVEDVDVDAEGTEAFHKGLEMLLRQDRRRHQDGDLLASCDGFEDGPHGHFSLAETDVAADQAVHGRRLFHAGLDIADGFQLIFRFFIRKGFFKFLLERRIRRKGIALDDFPLGIEGDEFFCQVGNGLLGLGPRLLPVGTAHFL